MDEIDNNNFVYVSIDNTEIDIDYLSSYGNYKDDKDLQKLYDFNIRKINFVDIKPNQQISESNLFNSSDHNNDSITFTKLLFELNTVSIIIIGYYVVNINFNDISINKTIFRSLIINNNGDNYYSFVDIIEDYIGYVKYNNVNVLKIECRFKELLGKIHNDFIKNI